MSDEQEKIKVEEPDWLPEESKERVRQVPDYQRNAPVCDACQ